MYLSNPGNNKGEVAKLKKALKESEEKVEKVTIDKVRVDVESRIVQRMNSNLESMLAMFRGAGVMQQAGAAPPVSLAATLLHSQPGQGQRHEQEEEVLQV